MAHLVAVEPSARTYGLLHANVAAAGLTSRTTLLRLALGAAPGTAQLTYYPRMPGNSTLHPAAQWEARVAFREERRRSMYESKQVAAARASMWLCCNRRAARVPWCRVPHLCGLSCILVHHARVARLEPNCADGQPLALAAPDPQVTCEVATLSEVLRRAAVAEVALLKLDVEHHEVEVLGGIEPPLWQRVQQVVVETHTADACAGVLGMLGQHFAVVESWPDESLAQCGLEHAIVTARLPKSREHERKERRDPEGERMCETNGVEPKVSHVHDDV
eukprot:6070716-Prymnesium_polylepis.1